MNPQSLILNTQTSLSDEGQIINSRYYITYGSVSLKTEGNGNFDIELLDFSSLDWFICIMKQYIVLNDVFIVLVWYFLDNLTQKDFIVYYLDLSTRIVYSPT